MLCNSKLAPSGLVTDFNMSVQTARKPDSQHDAKRKANNNISYGSPIRPEPSEMKLPMRRLSVRMSLRSHRVLHHLPYRSFRRSRVPFFLLSRP